MKTLATIVSVLLYTVLPSALMYTLFEVYIGLHPIVINIITGFVMFIFGGVLIATRGNNQEKDEDGGTTK